MLERKCDFPPLVELSKGRAVCPDNLYKGFKLKANCGECHKAKGLERLFVGEPANLGDQIARQIVRNQMYKR